MPRASAAKWWNNSWEELGVQGMDRTLSPDAEWEDVLQSGREEFAAALQVIPLQTGADRRVLDVGCGMGRVSFALAEQFGAVVGIDISDTLIHFAQSHNSLPHVSFHHQSGPQIKPENTAVYHTVFSNEVFYYLTWPTLTSYCRDAFRLLQPGGEFAFQLNLEPIGWITRISWMIRHFLFRCGIKNWRGWSNGPGFRRYHHPVDSVRGMLEGIGFRVERIGVGRSIRQTWFLAVKPIQP